MIDFDVLLIIIGVIAAIGGSFAFVGWYGYIRSGLRGVFVVWLGGTVAGTIFMASGVAAPRGAQNLTEFVTALLVSSFIFGAGALAIILWIFLQQPNKAGEVLCAGNTQRFSLGLAISVSGAMIFAFVLSFFMLIMFAQHEL